MDEKHTPVVIPAGLPEAGSEMEELLSTNAIRKIVERLGEEISEAYQDPPVLVGVLKGSVIFLADLARALSIDCELDFVKISSYGNGTKSSGSVTLEIDLSIDVSNKDIVIVEDIVDSGRSFKFLNNHFSVKNPRSVSFCTLLLKPESLLEDVNIEFCGMEIPDKFVIGYGLDLAQKMRGLSAIYVINTED